MTLTEVGWNGDCYPDGDDTLAFDLGGHRVRIGSYTWAYKSQNAQALFGPHFTKGATPHDEMPFVGETYPEFWKVFDAPLPWHPEASVLDVMGEIYGAFPNAKGLDHPDNCGGPGACPKCNMECAP